MKNIKTLYVILIATLMLFANGCSNGESLKEEDNKSASNISIIKQEGFELREKTTR